MWRNKTECIMYPGIDWWHLRALLVFLSFFFLFFFFFHFGSMFVAWSHAVLGPYDSQTPCFLYEINFAIWALQSISEKIWGENLFLWLGFVSLSCPKCNQFCIISTIGAGLYWLCLNIHLKRLHCSWWLSLAGSMNTQLASSAVIRILERSFRMIATHGNIKNQAFRGPCRNGIPHKAITMKINIGRFCINPQLVLCISFCSPDTNHKEIKSISTAESPIHVHGPVF